MNKQNIIIILIGILLLTLSCNTRNKKQSSSNENGQEELTAEEARIIAKEAYVYGFPLAMNYKTLYAYTLDKDSKEYKGDFNVIGCEARVYTPEDKTIVTPNSDTPYCMFWSDIRKEPVVISVPEMEEDRFYHFQLIDLFTHNFAYIGTLTTGNKSSKFLIAPSDWKGEKPEGITDIIYSETDLFFTIVRTQLMNSNDLERVKTLQGAYQLQLLSEYLGEEPAVVIANDNFPNWVEGDQFTEAIFKYIDVTLNLTKEVPSEALLRKQLAELNIGTITPYNFESFDKEIQEAIKQGVKEGFLEIETFLADNSSDPLGSAKIFGTREFLDQSAEDNYGLENLYLLRATAAQAGLYGNSGYEAIYPSYFVDSDGKPLNASENKYVITIKKTMFPPVKAFWSLTMYDGKTQLLVENPLSRYLLNSAMMDNFVMGEDGSLTLYIQKDSPDAALEANWLPAPDGRFYSVMRLYGPEEAALTGAWVNPPITKSN